MTTTSRRLRINVGLGTAALAIAIYTLLALHDSERAKLVLCWPAGTEIDYRLKLIAGADVALAGNLAGDIDLDVDLTLRSHGRESGRWLLELELGQLRRHHVAVLGRELDASSAVLAGQRAFVLVADDGAIERVYVEPGAPPLFKDLAQSMVPLLQVTVPEGAGERWSAREPGPSGTARVGYRAHGSTLLRTRERYERLSALPNPPPAARPTLAGSGRITLTDGGQVAEIHDRERMSLQLAGQTLLDTHATLDLEQVARRHSITAPVALERLEVREPGGPTADSQATRRDLLTQQAAGLTRHDLLDGVARFATLDGDIGRAWFVRAAALIALDPTLAPTLAERFAASGASPPVRVMIADLLAAAGTPEAQTALRASYAALDGDKQAEVAIVQRFARLNHPDGASTELVRRTFREAAGDVRYAAAYTLGAIASHSDADGARAIARELTAALDVAREPDAQRELLAALGNAGQAETTPAIARFASDADPSLRARSAQALRKIATGDAASLLTTLAHDGDARVATEALAVLAARPLDGATLTQITDGAHPGVSRALDAAWVGLAAQHLDGGASVRALLQSLATSARDRETQSRAHALLGRLNG